VGPLLDAPDWPLATMKGPRSRKPRRPRQQVPPEAARSESRRVDFKESLDVASPGEWVDCGPLLKFDPANIVDKIAVYTGQQLVRDPTV